MASDWLPAHKVLSLGIVDGRNVWRSDLDAALALMRPWGETGRALWLAPSCSLLHVPVSLAGEDGLDAELKSWFAFAGKSSRNWIRSNAPSTRASPPWPPS